jgi:hypothetical protein
MAKKRLTLAALEAILYITVNKAERANYAYHY